MPHMVPRYLAFAFVPPEIVSNSYLFKPMGIFTMENKVIKSAQFMDWVKTFAMVVNMPEAAKYSAQIMGTSDDVDKMVMPMPMMPPGGPEGPPGGPGKPPGSLPGAPGLRGGADGNKPSFLPPEVRNPLRRQPVVG
jgi:hypothetical protein